MNTENQTQTTQTLPALFNAGEVEYSSGKKTRTIAAEAALFKGGKALAALKGQALSLAATKAAGGRYKAAVDILTAAYPKAAGAFIKDWGFPQSGMELSAFLTAIEAVMADTPAPNKRQLAAKVLVETLRAVPALKGRVKPARVVQFVEG